MSLEPIRHELAVPCSRESAFDVYANRIGEWWHPAYTASAETFETVSIEPRVGGRVTEVHAGGRVIDWGEVTAWEPGRRLSYTSTLAQTPESPSEITVLFEPDGDGCKVVFEHGGWNERNQSDRSKFTDWPLLLGRFAVLAQSRGA